MDWVLLGGRKEGDEGRMLFLGDGEEEAGFFVPKNCPMNSPVQTLH